MGGPDPGGVTGDVMEIGLFATTIHTADNLRVYVGNAKVLNDNIINYTQNEFRRVDLKAQIAHSVDPKEAIAKLSARLAQIPNVVKTPPPASRSAPPGPDCCRTLRPARS